MEIRSKAPIKISDTMEIRSKRQNMFSVLLRFFFLFYIVVFSIAVSIKRVNYYSQIVVGIKAYGLPIIFTKHLDF